MTFTVTYRDSWNKLHTFDIEAESKEAAIEAAVEWKGNAPVSIVSVELKG